MTTDQMSTNAAMMLFLVATFLLLMGVIWMGHLRYMMGTL